MKGTYHTVLLFIFVMLMQHTSLQGQTFFKFNQYNVLYDGTFMPVVTLFTNYSFTDKLAFSSYFYVNGTKGSSWGEGLAGPAWTPAPGVTLLFLAGIQSNEAQLLRFSPVFNINRNRFSAFGAFEFGGERHRWDVMCFYAVPPFRVGGELIRFYQMYAAGPRIEFSFIRKHPLTVFYSGLWDWKHEKFASMFGLYSNFGGR